MCGAPGSKPGAPGTKRGGPEQVLVETGEVSGTDALRTLRGISQGKGFDQSDLDDEILCT